MLDAELAETLIHLSLFAQLGVLIREYLCRFFVNGCDGTSWGPCRTCRNSLLSPLSSLLSPLSSLLSPLYSLLSPLSSLRFTSSIASLTLSSHARTHARSVGRSV